MDEFKNGWESLIGCENAVFYNFKTISYSPKAVSKKTDKTWNNMQYCKDIVFQGTTWDSVNNSIDKMKNLMSGITVADNTVKAEVIPVSTIDTSVTDIQASKPESTAAQQTTEVQKTVIQQSAEEYHTRTKQSKPNTTPKAAHTLSSGISIAVQFLFPFSRDQLRWRRHSIAPV